MASNFFDPISGLSDEQTPDPNFFLRGFSPKREDLLLSKTNDLIEPFEVSELQNQSLFDSKLRPDIDLFQKHEFNNCKMQIFQDYNKINLGDQSEFPGVKKQRITQTQSLFLGQPKNYMGVDQLRESTQSETSQNKSLLLSQEQNSHVSFQSVQNSFISLSNKNDDSNNSSSQFDQSGELKNRQKKGENSKGSLAKKKRNIKEESKKSLKPGKGKKKINEESFESSMETSQALGMGFISKLTNKKREYLQEQINDKNGYFDYLQDPNEYKKARKRMQNRESAVRSRMRKRYYQDDLEETISQLQKRSKDLSEENAGLSAQNALLKKQLQYFEDMFANQYLVSGPEASTMRGNQVVQRNELELFKYQLLQKINAKFQDQDSMFEKDELLEVVPGSLSRQLDESGESTSMSPHENSLENLRLIRKGSNMNGYSSHGYLFLAVVFCMMCCSSIVLNPLKSTLSKVMATQQSQGFTVIPQFDGSRHLKFSQTSQKKKAQNLAESNPDEEDAEMKDEEDQGFNLSKMAQLMLSGHYTYLTYLIMSTTCFFLWLTPNFYKFRGIFRNKNKQLVYEKPQKTKAQSTIATRRQTRSKQQ